MKKLFCDDSGNVSMGRFLSFILFFCCLGMWIFIKATSGEIDANDMTLIQWGWGFAVIGKAAQKAAENFKR